VNVHSKLSGFGDRVQERNVFAVDHGVVAKELLLEKSQAVSLIKRKQSKD
jgi:hypothetical protein